MKVAAAKAIALLARENVPDEVVSAYGGDWPMYGKNYIIPSTFDPRLISVIPSAVAEAAMKSGVARKNIVFCGRFFVILRARCSRCALNRPHFQKAGGMSCQAKESHPINSASKPFISAVRTCSPTTFLPEK